MRLKATGCVTLLLLFFSAPGWTAGDDGPVTEIVLDCSLAMKAAGPGHSARIDLAWQALARHYLSMVEDPRGHYRPPALRLAGGSTDPDNPWRPGQLVHDGSSGPPPFLPGHPLPPAPVAGGLLPLSETLVAAARDLGRRGDRRQGFILLIAAGWEGGAGNPHDLAHGSQNGNGAPVIHVIGLAPLPAEARQLRQLAAKTGGIYREVGGPAGLGQTLGILAESGGIRFTAASASGAPPPPGSRLRIVNRHGWYRRDFDYQDWIHRGGQIWVPAGPYDLELTCSGQSAPFRAPSLSVDRGRLSRHTLTLPEQGLLTIQVTSPGGTERRRGSSISISDADNQPVYRFDDRDQCSVRLFPGEYLVRVRPHPVLGEFGEEARAFRISEQKSTAIYVHLPAEGRLVIEKGDSAPRVRIEKRDGTEIWYGRADNPLTLPEGRYRLRVLDKDGERVSSKRFRIRGGKTCRLGPFATE